MNTGADKVHQRNGVLGVDDNENQQNEICATGCSQGTRERKETENIVDTKKVSGEDYAKKILDFLEAGQAARQKKTLVGWGNLWGEMTRVFNKFPLDH